MLALHEFFNSSASCLVRIALTVNGIDCQHGRGLPAGPFDPVAKARPNMAALYLVV
jgi:hypothetical protein